MPRTPGSTASHLCKTCKFQNIEQRIIIRDKGEGNIAWNYNSVIDGPHSCRDFGFNIIPDNDSGFDEPNIWYEDGKIITPSVATEWRWIAKTDPDKFASMSKYRTNKGYPSVQAVSPVQDPEPETPSEPVPSVVQPPADVAGAINVLFGSSLDNLENRLRALIAEGLIESENHTKSGFDSVVHTIRDLNEWIETIEQNGQSFVETQTAVNETFAERLESTQTKVQELMDAKPIEHFTSIKINDEPAHVIDGRTHKLLPTLVKRVKRGSHLWLAGPAGSGKTTAAIQVAETLGRQYQVISCGPATDQYDLFGYTTPDGRYVPGLARKMYEEGGILMLDEIDNTQPSVLTSMNNALSGCEATFPDGTVKRHEDFVCIAGANTFGRGADRLYCGRNQIDAASIDRFGFISFDYDEEAELEWAGSDQRSWVQYVQALRQAAMERRMQVVISPRASIFGARDLRDGDHWDETADCWIWARMASADREILQAAVNSDNFRRMI